MDTSVEFSYCPTEGCGRTLIVGPNEEPYWCDECCQAFDSEDIRVGSLWRKMSLAERSAEIERYGDGVVERYRITAQQYAQAKDMVAGRVSARTLFVGDVSPAKATLPSLARGISDVGALRELIDNARDSAQRKHIKTPVTVSIEFDATDGTVIVRDNAGGMNKEDMLRCLKLGAVRTDNDTANVLGRFSVGAKEAIYHFGREVIIRSRELGASDGLRVEVPEAWLDRSDWNVEVQAADNVQPGSTEIRIGSLVKFDFAVAQIADEIWHTYRKKFREGSLTVLINGEEVRGEKDPDLLYLPELYPRSYVFQALGVTVDLSVCVLRDSPADSGIFFYVFGRQYAHWLWNEARTRMLFDKPPQHKLNTHFRVDIDFSGVIDEVPINANKDEVETNSRVFSETARTVQQLCQPYLDCVSWLSSDGRMTYVDRFAGPQNAHRHAKLIETPFDLAKPYKGMTFSRESKADASTFKRVLEADIRLEREESAPKPRDVTLGLSNGTTQDASKQTPQAASSVLPINTPSDAPARAPVLAQLRIQTKNIDAKLLQHLRAALKAVSEEFNVTLEFIE